jgi:hypothetical protein
MKNFEVWRKEDGVSWRFGVLGSLAVMVSISFSFRFYNSTMLSRSKVKVMSVIPAPNSEGSMNIGLTGQASFQ